MGSDEKEIIYIAFQAINVTENKVRCLGIQSTARSRIWTATRSFCPQTPSPNANVLPTVELKLGIPTKHSYLVNQGPTVQVLCLK